MKKKAYSLSATYDVIRNVKNNLGDELSKKEFAARQNKKPKPLFLITPNGDKNTVEFIYPLKSNNKLYYIKALEPISNFYNEALKWLNNFDQLHSKIDNNTVSKFNEWKIVSDEHSCDLINSKIQSIVFFMLALEALVNSKIPDIKNIPHKKSSFSKREIEKSAELKDKIKIVLEHLKKGKSKIQTEVDILLTAYKIRNDLVHTKTSANENAQDNFINHHYKAFTFDLKKLKASFDKFQDYLNAP